jgi:hypothetical protein
MAEMCRCTLHNKMKGKGKGTVHPITGHEGPEGEYRYSYTLSITSALDGVDGQRQAPAALLPEKNPVPIV